MTLIKKMCYYIKKERKKHTGLYIIIVLVFFFCSFCVFLFTDPVQFNKNVVHGLLPADFFLPAIVSSQAAAVSFTTYKFVDFVNAPALCKGHTWYCLILLAFPHSLCPWISLYLDNFSLSHSTSCITSLSFFILLCALTIWVWPLLLDTGRPSPHNTSIIKLNSFVCEFKSGHFPLVKCSR